MVDFTTDRMIIVSYPGGAGGKTLINMLGMSDHAVLQDQNLANQQLDNNLTANDKYLEIMQRLSATDKKWQDLGMGDIQFFSYPDYAYLDSYPETVRLRVWPRAVERTYEQGLYFFHASHSSRYLERLIECWPNAKHIVFQNSEKFMNHFYYSRVKHYMPQYLDFWNAIRDQELWPDYPPWDMEEFRLLPDYIQEEITQVHADVFFRLMPNIQAKNIWLQKSSQQTLELVKHQKDVYFFDAACLLDQDSLPTEVEKIYQWLEMKDFSEDLVRQYHCAWLKKLDQIEQQHQEKKSLYHNDRTYIAT